MKQLSSRALFLGSVVAAAAAATAGTAGLAVRWADAVAAREECQSNLTSRACVFFSLSFCFLPFSSFNPTWACHRHEAADEDEAFEIMNLVDPVLRTSNSGAVLAAINCFLLLTKDMPDMHYQVTRQCVLLFSLFLSCVVRVPLLLSGVIESVLYPPPFKHQQ